MGNLKKFVGEYAYNIIKNMVVDEESLRKALVTPQNARAIFSDLNEFDIKSLCTEISNSGRIGQVRETKQEEILEAFNSIGYDKVIFDNESEIFECKKYYKTNEVICTYNNLKGRMNQYHMLVAIKSNINKIERSKNPQREDEYGTSILNIQIARNGSHMSIKNRYNHTVSQPDSTLNNNLDLLYPGLQSMVLGYYGFASLGDKKTYYDNIVNINNVYLKYHAEKNNVYYGNFVLDSTNGVRFADSSRYYITSGESVYKYSTYPLYPLVLDFKDKKVIDVSQDKTSPDATNTKISLLTRAMKEGKLSSGNKTEVDKLKITFLEAKKELLLTNKNALSYIHDSHGYDFTKPYKVTAFLGKFTAKSIEKATGCNNGILLIGLGEKMTVCLLDRGEFYISNLSGGCYYNISYFYTKRDFEAIRKSGIAATYLIQQEKQYIGNPKPKIRKSYHYIKRHEFDKSGYDITKTRLDLALRVTHYKAEKRKKEASEIDYTQDIRDIEKSFDELKEELIMKLTKAETSNDYRKITDVVSYTFYYMVRDIEDIKNHVNKKSFVSIDFARKKIERVKETITDFKLKLA